MISPSILAITFALSSALPAAAQRYGHNSVRVSRDSDLVAANFPTPNITLYGPAFQSNVTLLPGFSSGTQPPIDDATLGIIIYFVFVVCLANRSRSLHPKPRKQKSMDDIFQCRLQVRRRSQLSSCAPGQYWRKLLHDCEEVELENQSLDSRRSSWK